MWDDRRPLYYYYRKGTDLELGDTTNIEEYRNDEPEGRCPFCHEKVRTIYCKWDPVGMGDIPIGCFHCVDEIESPDFEIDDDGRIVDKLDEEAAEWEREKWEREKRDLCRGTNYEY